MSKHHYQVRIEDYLKTYEELKSLYKQSYEHLVAIYARDGRIYPKYNPWLSCYKEHYEAGSLILYVIREDSKVAGYCMMYLTQDMQNQELVTCEEGLYILPEHRNGIGKILAKMIIQDMRSRGVKRITLSAIDQRIVNLWKTIGFKEVATTMELEL